MNELTEKQTVVLQGIADGHTLRHIAQTLGVHERTVIEHTKAIRRKFGNAPSARALVPLARDYFGQKDAE